VEQLRSAGDAVRRCEDALAAAKAAFLAREGEGTRALFRAEEECAACARHAAEVGAGAAAKRGAADAAARRLARLEARAGTSQARAAVAAAEGELALRTQRAADAEVRGGRAEGQALCGRGQSQVCGAAHAHCPPLTPNRLPPNPCALNP